MLKPALVSDIIVARGHENVSAKSPRTIEITKDPYVTRRGDCIIACCADRGAGEISEDVLRVLERPNNIVVVVMRVGNIVEVVRGRSPGVRPSCLYRLVLRRSTYADCSTIMIGASKAAVDLNREFVELLRRYWVIEVRVLAIDLHATGEPQVRGVQHSTTSKYRSFFESYIIQDA